METFTTAILRFNKMNEKTGWTYIEIPADVAQRLKSGNKKSFRVKGTLDKHPIKLVALMPMGNGNFIMAINESMRKGTGKKYGAMLEVSIEIDTHKIPIDAELIECMEDVPEAKNKFNALSNSHQAYYSNWIASAKTIETKTKRIMLTIDALLKKQSYSQMIGVIKNKNTQ